MSIKQVWCVLSEDDILCASVSEGAALLWAREIVHAASASSGLPSKVTVIGLSVARAKSITEVRLTEDGTTKEMTA